MKLCTRVILQICEFSFFYVVFFAHCGRLYTSEKSYTPEKECSFSFLKNYTVWDSKIGVPTPPPEKNYTV